MEGNKVGVATKEEIKALWKIGSEKLPIPGILKPILNSFVPGWIDGLDNKYGDNIPEPWQLHCENLVTLVVKSLEDKVITQGEADESAVYCAKVIDERIDVPLLEDDGEAVVFLEATRFISSLLFLMFKKKVS